MGETAREFAATAGNRALILTGGCVGLGAGVAGLLSELTAELGHAMTLAGARTVSEITGDLVA